MDDNVVFVSPDLPNMATSILKDAQDFGREVKKLPVNKVLRKRVVLETILKHVGDFVEVDPVLARTLLDTVSQLDRIGPKVDTVSDESCPIDTSSLI